MKHTLNLLLAVCLTLLAFGCGGGGPVVNNLDAGPKPAGQDASVCSADKKCGAACCSVTQACDTTATPSVCKTCSCGARLCGNDECGNSCGTCTGVGTTCNATGQCVPLDRCTGVTCNTGETCDTADGFCKCSATSCTSPKVCSTTKHCVDATDPCVSKVCSDSTLPNCVNVGGIATCECVGGSCGTGYTCVAGVCQVVVDRCAGVSCGTGETCDSADGICKCSATSCTSPKICSTTKHCVDSTDPCATKACTDATMPSCKNVSGAATCQCAGSSCGNGKTCDATSGLCETATCSPACVTGSETPDCDVTGATPTCKCNTSSCTGDKTCSSDGKCHAAATCNPACVAGSETPNCDTTGTTPKCVCTTSSCTSPKTCGSDGACHAAGTCTLDTTYSNITVSGIVTVDTANAATLLSGPLPASDGTHDEVDLELYDDTGVFAGGPIKVGTYQLTGDELDYATCGLCVRLQGNIDPSTGDPAAWYMATGGTVVISSVTGTLTATLTNGTFAHVDIAGDYTTTPDADGCATAINKIDFNGTFPVTCDPLAPTACDASTQGCYYDGSGYSCSDKGSVATGGTCSDTLICVPGDECLGNATKGYKCEKYCDVVAGTGCTGSDFCLSIGDPAVGACGPCPTSLCAAACCTSGKVCDTTATPNVCKTPPPCDPLATPDPCPANQACYYNWDSVQFQCDAAGKTADGSDCTAETDCVPGDGCGSNSTCVPYCDPAVDACGAGGTGSCNDYIGDGTLGYCE